MEEKILGYQRFLIGAAGGFCLTLIKLIEVKFFVGQPYEELVGGLLIAFSLMIIAAIFTTFLDDNTPGKLFRNSLLAPSVIFALVNQTGPLPDSFPEDGQLDIPDVGLEQDVAYGGSSLLDGMVVVPAAYADGRRSGNGWDPQAERQEVQRQIREIEELQKLKFGSGVLSGASRYLGRDSRSKAQDHLWVIGKAPDETTAQSLADQLDKYFSDPGSVRLVKPEGTDDIYITIESLKSEAGAKQLKDSTFDRLFRAPPDGFDLATLDLLRRGPIVDGRMLFKTKT